jgi:hypothetical protein
MTPPPSKVTRRTKGMLVLRFGLAGTAWYVDAVPLRGVAALESSKRVEAVFEPTAVSYITFVTGQSGL